MLTNCPAHHHAGFYNYLIKIRLTFFLFLFFAQLASAAPPTISSISPNRGAAGTSVAITGLNFSTTKVNNTVKFNGIAATVTSATATQLVVSVPSAATSGLVTVTVGGMTATSSSGFTVAPKINSFLPTSGIASSTTVTITGTNFSSNPTDNIVTFNDVPATVISATTTQLAATVPSGATTGKIGVTVAGQSALSGNNFNVTLTITGFSPASGTIGSQITVNGKGFSSNPYNNVVKLNGVDATAFSATTTQLTVQAPDTESGPITVTVNNNTTSSALNFIVLPSISNADWDEQTRVSGKISFCAPAGAPTTIYGNHFDSTPANNLVTFNGVPAQITSASQNQLKVIVPNAATTGPLIVSVNGLQSSAVPFTILKPLTVDGSAIAVSTGTPGTYAGFLVTASAGQSLGVGIQTLSVSPAASLSNTTILVGSKSNAWTGVYSLADCASSCAIRVDGGNPALNTLGSGLPYSDTYILLISSSDEAAIINGLFGVTKAIHSNLVLDGNQIDVDLTRPGAIVEFPITVDANKTVVLNWAAFSTKNGLPMKMEIHKPDGSLYLPPAEIAPGSSGILNLFGTAKSGTPPADETYTVVIQTIDGTIASASFSLRKSSVDVLITGITTPTSLAGTPYPVTVSITPPLGSPNPTGTVTIRDTNHNTECTYALPENGCVMPASGAVDGVALQAVYNGNTTYSPATSPLLVAFFPNNATSLAVTQIIPDPADAGTTSYVAFSLQPVTSVSGILPTGYVYISDGVNSCMYGNENGFTGGSCLLPAAAAGTRSVKASYSGDRRYASATSSPVTRSISTSGGPGLIPAGTEICGIVINSNSVPQFGFIPVDQLSGAVPSAGLVTDIIGDGNLTVEITSPITNSTTADAYIDVVGSFSGPTNTGITVNGIVAQTVNGQFLAPNVPLNPGINTLNIIATTLTGATATASASITREGTPLFLSIDVDNHSNQSTGYAPQTITFDLTIGSLPNNASILTVSVEYGYNLNSFIDNTGSTTNGAKKSFTYFSPGLYEVRLKIVDNNYNTYSAARHVLIQNFNMQRSMLCDIYGYLKDRLKAQDAAGAANAYQPLIRNQYQLQFATYGAQMPLVATNLGTIAAGRIAPGYADLTLIRDNSDQTRNGFPLRITQGIDGVWRISEM